MFIRSIQDYIVCVFQNDVSDSGWDSGWSPHWRSDGCPPPRQTRGMRSTGTRHTGPGHTCLATWPAGHSEAARSEDGPASPPRWPGVGAECPGCISRTGPHTPPCHPLHHQPSSYFCASWPMRASSWIWGTQGTQKVLWWWPCFLWIVFSVCRVYVNWASGVIIRSEIDKYYWSNIDRAAARPSQYLFMFLWRGCRVREGPVVTRRSGCQIYPIMTGHTNVNIRSESD